MSPSSYSALSFALLPSTGMEVDCLRYSFLDPFNKSGDTQNHVFSVKFDACYSSPDGFNSFDAMNSNISVGWSYLVNISYFVLIVA